MALEVETRSADNGITVVAPTGRLDVAGAPALKEAISEVVKNGPPRIVIDMEGVSFVDSTVLGVLVEARSRVTDKSTFVLAAPGKETRRVLDLSGLDKHFVVRDTVEQALGS